MSLKQVSYYFVPALIMPPLTHPRQEIETWVTALGHYDNNEFEEALKTFDDISDTSKILFNCGVIHATLGEHDKAVECYQRAIRLDNYLAVAYFQQGVSNFLVGDFEEALVNFNDTLLYLRGNTYINYEQLGLKFKLYSCEVLFNRGLCYIYLQQVQAGMGDLAYATKEKMTPDHDVIDEAIAEEAEGYTVFSIPVGVIYRPNSAKVKNLKAKDYLGKARLIAAADRGNTFTGFAGSEAKAKASVLETSRDDRPPESISFAASNLVRPGLTSRSRQQSAPPVNRNVFPPTPPPDHDQIKPAFVPTAASPPPKQPSFTGRANSVRNKPPRPERLDLAPSILNKELPRLGTVRTASEPRGPPRKYNPPRSRRDPPPSRGRLFMETTPRRIENGADADIDEYPDELYDMYTSRRPTRFSTERIPEESHPDPTNNDPSHSHRPSSRTRQPSRPRNRSTSRSRHNPNPSANPRYHITSDHDSDPATPSSSSLSDFEILNNAGGALSRPLHPSRTHTHAHSHTRERDRSSSRGPRHSRSRTRKPARPELRTIRVKVHASNNDDTRYIMMSAESRFEEFVERVREKFGLRNRFMLKVRDEGDLITMADGDDWGMAVEGVRKECEAAVGADGGGEMGKMEVSLLPQMMQLM
ncbi:MAG: hypothetical protein L6R37_001627 [Teloschistes peruensis]|nr:MAG: hypothetical protein L6R37_001627 [Teloschistes peruensis]